MMPMAQFVNTQLIPAITKAASFAAYSVALFTTGDASFATALQQFTDRGLSYERVNQKTNRGGSLW